MADVPLVWVVAVVAEAASEAQGQFVLPMTVHLPLLGVGLQAGGQVGVSMAEVGVGLWPGILGLSCWPVGVLCYPDLGVR